MWNFAVTILFSSALVIHKVTPQRLSGGCGIHPSCMVFKDSCYCVSSRFPYNETAHWYTAINTCQDYWGGTLASIATQEEIDFLYTNMGINSRYWIGLYKNTTNTSSNREGWRWLDGTSYDTSGWTAWHENNGEPEPQDGEHFATLGNKSWLGNQDDIYYYICEDKISSATTTTPASTKAVTTMAYSTSTTPAPTKPTEMPATATPKKSITTTPTSVVSQSTTSQLSLSATTASPNPGNQKMAIGIGVGVSVGLLLIIIIIAILYITRNRKYGTRKAVMKLRNLLDLPDTLKKPQNTDTELENKITPYATMLVQSEKPANQNQQKKSGFMGNLASGLYENNMFSTAIRLEELDAWVRDAQASGLITQQYKSISMTDVTQSTDFCNQQQFKSKNIYNGIVPYDNNRVILSELPDSMHSHYINASYIDAYKEKAYIAAQGPIATTLNDFWRMIWEKSVRTVVMVTNQVESGKMKCVQYWPKGTEPEKFGEITVKLKKTENLPDYVIRHLAASKDGQHNIIKQYQFRAWPDHGIPLHAMGLLNFREKVKSQLKKQKPIVVHCSAGVGRTGTFLAIDYLIDQAKTGVVDFVKCLTRLRQQRPDMIQTADQYRFVIQAVLEASTLGQTTIPCFQYLSNVQSLKEPLSDGKSKMQKQFQLLGHYFSEETASGNKKVEAGLLYENVCKNRKPDFIPVSSQGVVLTTQVSGRYDYINAVFVNGHKKKWSYMATQAPLTSTVVDFWRAVYDYESTVIVMLCPQSQLQPSEIYYPEGTGDIFNVLPFVLESLEENTNNQICRQNISLNYCGTEREILHLSVTSDLSHMTYADIHATMLKLYEETMKWQQQQKEKNAPITVHCLDGVEWTGFYIALCNLFEHINAEQEVDVFHAVGQTRLARAEFINSMSQYEMLYDMVALYIDQFNAYSNFQ